MGDSLLVSKADERRSVRSKAEQDECSDTYRKYRRYSSQKTKKKQKLVAKVLSAGFQQCCPGLWSRCRPLFMFLSNKENN